MQYIENEIRILTAKKIYDYGLLQFQHKLDYDGGHKNKILSL